MKRLNILDYKNQRSAVSGKRSAVDGQRDSSYLQFCVLTAVCCLLFLISCAGPKIVEKPSHKGLSLDEAIAQYKKISSISSVLGLEYEKNDTIMSGDASLSISPDKLSLKIYYLGFLQGEVYEDNGTIKSKPKLDKNKSLLLVRGLKSSLFWWNIEDYTVSETADAYKLSNSHREVVISKESLLPTEQRIELENGDQLTISYASPSRITPEDNTEIVDNSPLGWYQSQIRIQLRNYIVRVNVKSYSVTK